MDKEEQFETWWRNEGWEPYRDHAAEVKELCRIAWENATFIQQEKQQTI